MLCCEADTVSCGKSFAGLDGDYWSVLAVHVKTFHVPQTTDKHSIEYRLRERLLQLIMPDDDMLEWFESDGDPPAWKTLLDAVVSSQQTALSKDFQLEFVYRVLRRACQVCDKSDQSLDMSYILEAALHLVCSSVCLVC